MRKSQRPTIQRLPIKHHRNLLKHVQEQNQLITTEEETLNMTSSNNNREQRNKNCWWKENKILLIQSYATYLADEVGGWDIKLAPCFGWFDEIPELVSRGWEAGVVCGEEWRDWHWQGGENVAQVLDISWELLCTSVCDVMDPPELLHEKGSGSLCNLYGTNKIMKKKKMKKSNLLEFG